MATLYKDKSLSYPANFIAALNSYAHEGEGNWKDYTFGMNDLNYICKCINTFAHCIPTKDEIVLKLYYENPEATYKSVANFMQVTESSARTMIHSSIERIVNHFKSLSIAASRPCDMWTFSRTGICKIYLAARDKIAKRAAV